MGVLHGNVDFEDSTKDYASHPIPKETSCDDNVHLHEEIWHP
jgi:hypothetical protein